MYASREGHFEIVNLLLERGAKVNTISNVGHYKFIRRFL